jgi:hypothetical protein
MGNKRAVEPMLLRAEIPQDCLAVTCKLFLRLAMPPKITDHDNRIVVNFIRLEWGLSIIVTFLVANEISHQVFV